jgi:hypothetical protein
MSADELSAGVNFLSYGITWDRAEKVFQQLAADKSLSDRFEELLRLHGKMSGAVKGLAGNVDVGSA